MLKLGIPLKGLPNSVKFNIIIETSEWLIAVDVSVENKSDCVLCLWITLPHIAWINRRPAVPASPWPVSGSGFSASTRGQPSSSSPPPITYFGWRRQHNGKENMHCLPGHTHTHGSEGMGGHNQVLSQSVMHFSSFVQQPQSAPKTCN